MSKRSSRENMLARDAVYKAQGKDPNPFKPETRIYKRWEYWHSRYWDMESQCQDLEVAYGSSPKPKI